MIIPILLIVFVGIPTVQGVGQGIGMFAKQDRECRKENKMTRVRGWLIEVYCEPEETTK